MSVPPMPLSARLRAMDIADICMQPDKAAELMDRAAMVLEFAASEFSRHGLSEAVQAVEAVE